MMKTKPKDERQWMILLSKKEQMKNMQDEKRRKTKTDSAEGENFRVTR